MKNKITKYNWIQLYSRRRLSPFPNIYSLESHTSLMKKVVGISYNVALFIFKDGEYWYFFDKSDYKKVGNAVLKKVIKNPLIFSELLAKQKTLGKKFLSWQKKLNHLEKKSNKKLYILYKKYVNEYKWLYANYFPILACELNFVEHLKKILRGKNIDNTILDKCFMLLTEEPKAMVNRQEEIASLRIAKQIIQNNLWLNLFNKTPLRVEKEITLYKKLYQIIKNHEKKYFWLTRDYEDPILTFLDFIIRIKKQLKVNPAAKLNNYSVREKKLLQERKTLIKKIKLNRLEAAQFSALRDGLHLKEFRKTTVSQSFYYFDKVLEEIGKRSGLSLSQVRYLLCDEVNKILKNDKSWNSELTKRYNLSAYFVKNGKSFIINDKETKKLFSSLLTPKLNAKELSGYVSSPGKAIGKAKIVLHPNECGKVNKGDIIVAPQVLPSYSIAISKSAGIVCDGGTGITTHSATLAREAKIPCLTGTKFATKLIKDGDLIEIDTDKKILRILKE